jgi:hypothetical protein
VSGTAGTSGTNGNFITGSLYNITSSWAVTASYALNAVSASHSTTASYALNAVSASYAPNIYVLPNNVVSASAQLSNGGGTAFTNSNNITVGQITASAISVTALSVVTITSSIAYASGSNIFGTKSTDTQLFTGSVNITGSLGVVGNITSNNVLSLAAGTVLLPSLILATDTTSGMYRIGANNIGISISAAKVLDISSTGLSVTGALSSTGEITANTNILLKSGNDLRLYNTANDAFSQLYNPGGSGAHQLAVRLNGTNVATFTSTGLNSTAIGATTRAAGSFTTVASSGGISGGIFTSTVAGTEVDFLLGNNDAGRRVEIGTNAGGHGVLKLRNASNVETITANAGTGLAVTGTLSSTGILSGPGFRASKTTASSGLIKIQDEGANVYNVIGSRNNADSAALPLNFQATNFVFNAAVDVTGGLVVGVAGTGTGITIKEYSAGTQRNWGIRDDFGVDRLRFSRGASDAVFWDVLKVAASDQTGNQIWYTNGAERMQLSSSGLLVTGNISNTFTGNTRIGHTIQDTTTTSDSAFIQFLKSTGGVIGQVTRVGTTDAVVYNTSSDSRLKENFRDFTDSGRLVDALKPRVFDWKNSDERGKNAIGFIAQEINSADPIFAHIGAVSVGDEDPDTITKQWHRSDAALIPILVAELQSLRTRNASIEARLAALESK